MKIEINVINNINSNESNSHYVSEFELSPFSMVVDNDCEVVCVYFKERFIFKTKYKELKKAINAFQP